jgi:hypothetical protein
MDFRNWLATQIGTWSRPTKYSKTCKKTFFRMAILMAEKPFRWQPKAYISKKLKS